MMIDSKLPLKPRDLAALCRAGVIRPDDARRELVEQGYKLPRSRKRKRPEPSDQSFAKGVNEFTFIAQYEAGTTPEEMGKWAADAFRRHAANPL